MISRTLAPAKADITKIMNSTAIGCRSKRRRFGQLQVGQLVVELDLHPHGSERLDQMRLIRPYEPGTASFKDYLGGRLEHLITQPTFEHSNDTPHAGLKAMFPTQSSWQRIFIEHRSALIRGRADRGPSGALMKVSHPGNVRLVQQG